MGKSVTLSEYIQSRTPVDAARLGVWLHQLAMLLHCGVGILSALDLLEAQEAHQRLRRTTNRVNRIVATEGCPLSVACGRYTGVFPPQVVMLMEVGEQGGGLALTLRQAGDLMQAQSALLHRLRQALATAGISLLVSFLLVFILFKTVMPRFMMLFDGMSGGLPWVTRAAAFLVAMVNNPVFTVVVLALALLLLAFKDALTQMLATVLLRHPGTRPVLGQVLAITFCQTAARLYSVGVPMAQIIDLVARSTRFEYDAYFVGAMRRALEQGQTLAEAAALVPYYPRVVREMMAVGETTGTLDRCLTMAARLLDDNTQYLIQRVVTLLEPMALFVTGGVVLFFVAAIFLPMYQLLQAVH